jgi:Protein of unknown function (DUF1173)
MTAYRFGDVTLTPDSPDFPATLVRAYTDRIRPVCTCKEPGPEMYIAHFGNQYLVKRMPYSGISHAAECDSFEAPPELSGRGILNGTAIQRTDEGTTALKFDFSLSRNGVAANRGAATEKTSVTSSGNRLTLRGFLHYLWDEAELTHWRPGFTGKRNWFVLRRRLMAEAEGKEAKKTALSSLLFIPEFYDQERKHQLSQRRMSRVASISGASGKRMMLLIGEYERISEGRSDSTMYIKHLPDFPFRMTANLRKDFDKKFGKVVGLFDFIQDSHLMVIATFSIDVSGTPEIGEISVMLTTPNWIPIESMYENELIGLLSEKKRSFIKVLRYNLTKQDPMPSAILTDTSPEAYGLYVVLGELDKAGPSREAMQEMIATTRYPSWVWDPASGIPPDLPAQSHARTPPSFPSNGKAAVQPGAGEVITAEPEKHEAAPVPQA